MIEKIEKLKKDEESELEDIQEFEDQQSEIVATEAIDAFEDQQSEVVATEAIDSFEDQQSEIIATEAIDPAKGNRVVDDISDFPGSTGSTKAASLTHTSLVKNFWATCSRTSDDRGYKRKPSPLEFLDKTSVKKPCQESASLKDLLLREGYLIASDNGDEDTLYLLATKSYEIADKFKIWYKGKDSPSALTGSTVGNYLCSPTANCIVHTFVVEKYLNSLDKKTIDSFLSQWANSYSKFLANSQELSLRYMLIIKLNPQKKLNFDQTLISLNKQYKADIAIKQNDLLKFKYQDTNSQWHLSTDFPLAKLKGEKQSKKIISHRSVKGVVMSGQQTLDKFFIAPKPDVKNQLRVFVEKVISLLNEEKKFLDKDSFYQFLKAKEGKREAREIAEFFLPMEVTKMENYITGIFQEVKMLHIELKKLAVVIGKSDQLDLLDSYNSIELTLTRHLQEKEKNIKTLNTLKSTMNQLTEEVELNRVAKQFNQILDCICKDWKLKENEKIVLSWLEENQFSVKCAVGQTRISDYIHPIEAACQQLIIEFILDKKWPINLDRGWLIRLPSALSMRLHHHIAEDLSIQMKTKIIMDLLIEPDRLNTLNYDETAFVETYYSSPVLSS